MNTYTHGGRLINRNSDGYAARDEVERFAEGLSVGHLACREMGHNWRAWTARFDAEHNSFERALRCTRCRTERHQSIGLSGAMLSNNYKYPEGYSAEGIGRIVGEGRDALRLESMTRTLKSVQPVQDVG